MLSETDAPVTWGMDVQEIKGLKELSISRAMRQELRILPEGKESTMV